jgi:hypothetical protein
MLLGTQSNCSLGVPDLTMANTISPPAPAVDRVVGAADTLVLDHEAGDVVDLNVRDVLARAGGEVVTRVGECSRDRRRALRDLGPRDPEDTIANACPAVTRTTLCRPR